MAGSEKLTALLLQRQGTKQALICSHQHLRSDHNQSSHLLQRWGWNGDNYHTVGPHPSANQFFSWLVVNRFSVCITEVSGQHSPMQTQVSQSPGLSSTCCYCHHKCGQARKKSNLPHPKWILSLYNTIFGRSHSKRCCLACVTCVVGQEASHAACGTLPTPACVRIWHHASLYKLLQLCSQWNISLTIFPVLLPTWLTINRIPLYKVLTKTMKHIWA